MCVICAAIPTTLAAGLTIEKKDQQRNKSKEHNLLSRPYKLLTLLTVAVLMTISVYFHSRSIS
jgi:hypothetical protein